MRQQREAQERVSTWHGASPCWSTGLPQCLESCCSQGQRKNSSASAWRTRRRSAPGSARRRTERARRAAARGREGERRGGRAIRARNAGQACAGRPSKTGWRRPTCAPPAGRRAHVMPLGRWAAGPLGRWAAGPLGAHCGRPSSPNVKPFERTNQHSVSPPTRGLPGARAGSPRAAPEIPARAGQSGRFADRQHYGPTVKGGKTIARHSASNGTICRIAALFRRTSLSSTCLL